MNKPVKPIGLGFFGAVIASISHEIKNRLAIINEQTLLGKDLAQAAAGGRQTPPDRFVDLADAVKTEIDTADTIIKMMNRFAHSVDTLKNRIDMNEAINLTATLYERIARMQNATIQVHPPETPVHVDTVFFFLMNLIWLCLNAALEGNQEPRTIGIESAKTATGAAVWLQVGPTRTDMQAALASEEMTDLADALGARVSFLAQPDRVQIDLPPDIDWP